MTVTTTTTYDGAYTVVKFSGTGTIDWIPPARIRKVWVLVVAGGGGGGRYYGGGGGGGGLLEEKEYTLISNRVTVTVGGGGPGNSQQSISSNMIGTVGEDSVFDTLIAKGGGPGNGGGSGTNNGGGGGSGGGCNPAGATGGIATPAPQGHDGGAGANNGGSGGGGAGEDGHVGGSNGDGGDGLPSSITGTAVYYAGGGGGSANTPGQGGLGGGGRGATNSVEAVAGTDDLGGGGGGGSYPSPQQFYGMKGGRGIVIVRFLTIGDWPATLGKWVEGGTDGTLYIIDPVEVTAKFSAATNEYNTLIPPVSEATAKFTPSAPVTFYQCVISSTVKFSAKVAAKVFVNIATLKLEEITVSKNVNDMLWNCSCTLFQYYALDLTAMRNVIYVTTDHLGVSHALFTGIVPETAPEIEPANNKTRLTAQDFGWYLANQMVPSTYHHNTAGTNPATVITGLLGGNAWEIGATLPLTSTGIEPYNIDPVAAWGTTLNSRVFDFDAKTTKIQAIQRICDYCRYIFIVKWRLVGGTYRPAAYFISEDDIDTDLDLPAPVTIASGDAHLKGRISIVSKVTERYNHITVTGRNPSGTIYTAELSSPGLTNGDELPVDFPENSGAWTTQDQVTARCLELYNFYINPSTVWTATFRDRVDLELLQKIKFTGFTLEGLPEDWMRITSIRKTVSRALDKTVVIEFTTDQAFSNLRRMYRSNSPDQAVETEAIFDAKMAAVPANEVGTVTAIDPVTSTATITLEDGRIVTARIIT